MFSAYAAAKQRKMPGYAIPLMFGSGIFVAGLLIWMWVGGIWQLERLDPPKDLQDIAIAPPPPPPPPPPKGASKPHDQKFEVKKTTVKDIVQPVKIEKQEKAPEVQGDENGVEGGDPSGVVNGDPNGVVGAPPPPPPPPPPPAPPQVVPPTALEASRVSGEKNIVPDDVTKTEISRSGKDRLIGSFKLCLSTAGEIASVTQLKSTGFGAYDRKILNTIRGEWRYKPFEVNGKPVPVCTAVTFIYSQK